MFLDGEFIIWKPFGGSVPVTLLFEGSRAKNFEIVGHNGFGPTAFELSFFGDNDRRSFEELFPGVLIHAEGDFVFVFDRFELHKTSSQFLHPDRDGFHR